MKKQYVLNTENMQDAAQGVAEALGNKKYRCTIFAPGLGRFRNSQFEGLFPPSEVFPIQTADNSIILSDANGLNVLELGDEVIIGKNGVITKKMIQPQRRRKYVEQTGYRILPR